MSEPRGPCSVISDPAEGGQQCRAFLRFAGTHHCRGFNDRSIGIELVNSGRYPDWLDSRRQEMREPYPQAQLDALSGLLASLRRSLTGLRFIAGHEDLDTAMETASDDRALQVPRKRDPGPLFPWDAVLAECGLERLRP